MSISAISKIAAASLLSATISACGTFTPEYVACPDISVSGDADRVYVEGVTLGQVAQVRFNGISTQCVATSGGHDAEIDVGFLMKRDISESSLSEEVPLDVTFAFVDAADQVISRKVYSFSAFFPSYDAKSRPIFGINTEIPAGTRLVMGLGKAKDAKTGVE